MSAIDEIKKEIIERHQAAGPQPDTPAEAQEAPKEKPNQVKPAKKEMMKAEIEAYKQKMMEKEEARYLGKPAKSEKKAKKAKSSKPAKPAKSEKPEKPEKKAKKTKKVQKVQKSKKEQKVQKPPVQTAKMPKILKPLVPLYLLRIPGLPKGDCLAICYAEGADA